jgi:endonuclease YncB( thermonuclease family)
MRDKGGLCRPYPVNFRDHLVIMRRTLIICLLICVVLAAADIFGRARVIDGDTLQIGQTRIRLHGIGAPEASQICLDSGGQAAACGAAATRAIQVVVGTNTVHFAPRDIDRYGRTLASCPALGRLLARQRAGPGDHDKDRNQRKDCAD